MGEVVQGLVKKKKINPNHQMLCPKSRMGEEVKKKLTPTIRCSSQHLMVGVIFGGA